MPFQSTVAFDQGFGVPGELFLDGPTRAQAMLLDSASAAYNIIGATAFTVKSEGVAEAGGVNAFAGILANPKTQASNGTVAGGTLAPTLTLPNNRVAELVTMGQMIVTLPAAANIGDRVCYNTTTGALLTTAAEAAFTASQATTVLTVSAITKGNLGVGSIVRQASGQLSTIVALGTGTGGTGTYTLDTSQTVSSGAATATSVAPTGSAFVPGAFVDRQTVTGAGLGVITITA